MVRSSSPHPVSYTHLDVYKRQEYGVNMSKKIDEINAAMHAKEKEASEE